MSSPPPTPPSMPRQPPPPRHTPPGSTPRSLAGRVLEVVSAARRGMGQLTDAVRRAVGTDVPPQDPPQDPPPAPPASPPEASTSRRERAASPREITPDAGNAAEGAAAVDPPAMPPLASAREVGGETSEQLPHPEEQDMAQDTAEQTDDLPGEADPGKADPGVASAGVGGRRTFDVLMLGWEFPPFVSGGIGTALYGLTKAMSRRGDRVLFLMPGAMNKGFSGTPTRNGGATLCDFENVEFHAAGTTLSDPYACPEAGAAASLRDAVGETQTGTRPDRGSESRGYRGTPTKAAASGFRSGGRRPDDLPRAGEDVWTQRESFTARASDLARREREGGRRFEVVHGHDWLTFGASLRAGRELGVPVVLHVHSTELDRNPTNPDGRVVEAERAALADADAVVAVSRFTAETLTKQYGIDPSKVRVVHNALDLDSRLAPARPVRIGAGEKVVLFAGRVTAQKGADAFVRAAAKVLEVEPATRFVIAGDGQALPGVRQLARDLEIEDYILFTGFLHGDDVDTVMSAADVFVMPSVREPFGLVSLEAASRGVPVVLSTTSGAAEVLASAPRVDFWDTDALAARVVEILRDPRLAEQLGERGSFEVRQMRWSEAADALADTYEALTAAAGASTPDTIGPGYSSPPAGR